MNNVKNRSMVSVKLPEGIEGIASLLQLDVSELRAWPFFEHLRNAIKDYNLSSRADSKDNFLLEIARIKEKSSDYKEELHAFATHIKYQY